MSLVDAVSTVNQSFVSRIRAAFLVMYPRSQALRVLGMQLNANEP